MVCFPTVFVEVAAGLLLCYVQALNMMRISGGNCREYIDLSARDLISINETWLISG